MAGNRAEVRAPLIFAAIVCAASLLGCGESRRREARNEADPERFAQAGLMPCWIGSERAFCGSISVPADHDSPQASLDLAVAVLPAKAPKASNDPVVLLAGGPGQGSIEASPALSKVWRRVRRRRDVLLVDQRGTGGSSPLHCTFQDDDTLTAAFDLEFEREELLACRRSIEDRDLRLEWFSSAASADDLDLVRQALGYERLNLYGVSYGTRLALVFARRHPDAVRSLVLDAVAPTTMVLPLSMAKDGQRAFEALLADCESDAACSSAYPDLRDDASRVLDTMHADPEQATLRHPVTGSPESVRIDGDAVAGLIRAALYSPVTAAMVPHAIDRAAQGEMGPLAGLAAIGAGTSDALSIGLFLSIMCAEDVPRIEASARAEAVAVAFGRTSVPEFERACEVWDVPATPAAHAEPVIADVPALVLSGRLDPVTPPRWGEMAAQTLSPSRHVIIEDGGHGAFSTPCVDTVVSQFIEDPDSVADLDVGCLQDRGRPDFVLPNVAEDGS